jgi:hypothetical protein
MPGREILRRSWPLVALELQWRQDYPENRPPTEASAISAMGPHGLGQFRPSPAPFGGAEDWRTISCELNGSISAHGRASTLKT